MCSELTSILLTVAFVIIFILNIYILRQSRELDRSINQRIQQNSKNPTDPPITQRFSQEKLEKNKVIVNDDAKALKIERNKTEE
jgi:predicted PurR-regulated permease PerM